MASFIFLYVNSTCGIGGPHRTHIFIGCFELVLLILSFQVTVAFPIIRSATIKRVLMERVDGYCIEDLAVGMAESFSKTVTDSDIVMFAQISGDTNPVHLDEEYAAKSPFKSRVAHGMLTGALLSTVFGTKLPGPGTIYLSQTLKFRAPVRIGDTVTANVIVADIDSRKRHVQFNCNCSVDGITVTEGEAVVLVPSKGALS